MAFAAVKTIEVDKIVVETAFTGITKIFVYVEREAEPAIELTLAHRPNDLPITILPKGESA